MPERRSARSGASGCESTPGPAGREGLPVVLTADRTLMAGYRALFDGMMSASQTSRTPALLMKGLLAPALAREGLAARQAPLGLRRIEAALVSHGWDPRDVAIVRPEDIKRAIGPATRVIGVSSGDPLGMGMNSNTMAGIAGGEIYTSRWFRALLARIARVRARALQARVVVGGPGAWQLCRNDDACRGLGIDHVLTGYAETSVGKVFRELADGNELPQLIPAQPVNAQAIPAIRAATVMGAVEVSRGCGLGCGFCTIGRSPMLHLPIDTIIADVQTNVAAGVTAIALVTEDIFRFAAKGNDVRPDALIALLSEIRRLPGLGLLQTDHANVTSTAQFSDHELAEVHRLFAPEGSRHDYVWLNLGVETASGELLAANGGRPKMAPYAPGEWAEVCMEQVRRLTAAGFFPFISLLMGLPGEDESHVEASIRWVARLRGERVAVFPLFYAPIDGRGPAFGVQDMSPAHWRLFRACYRLNFKWVPRLCWDNQSAAGVALWKRMLMQALGRAQVGWWKALFAWRSGRLFAHA